MNDDLDLPAVDDYSGGYYNDPYGSWDVNPYIPQSDIEALADLGGTPAQQASLLNTFERLVGTAGTGIMRLFTKGGTGADKDDIDWRKVAATAGGLYGMLQSNRPQERTGYQGKIPTYEAVREAVPGSQYDPTRRPGSGGQRYLTDVKYAAPGEAATTARAAAKEEAAGLAALNKANLANEARSAPTEEAAKKGAESDVVREGVAASKVIETLPPKYAHGGITALAQGRYLNGASDGMADKIPARIDDKQEARLSHGEFVIPADVVSHLGNGNSEAGAQRLYDMMDRIRKARTGTVKQGRQVNPNKFMPG